MNRILIATCVLGFAALAACQPTGQSAANVCIEMLAGKVSSVGVAQPILDLAEFVEADYPFNGELDWGELADKQRQKYFARYPVLSCEKFTETVNDIFQDALMDDERCAAVLEGDDEVLKMSRAHKLLGPVMKAREACFAFEPHTREQGTQV